MPLDMTGLFAADARWKPERADATSCKLTELWNDTATALTINHLRDLGLGNPENTAHPFQVSMTRRMVEAFSVCYSSPALRRLVKADGTEYADDSPEMEALEEAFDRSAYDLLWMKIDGLRNLYRSVVLEWIEDPEYECVSLYVFPPHCVRRWPDPAAPGSIERDKMIGLLVQQGQTEADRLYRVWIRGNDGSWRAVISNGVGQVQQELYAVSPTGPILPLQLVHDEHPLGQPWLPVPESRVAWALGINAAINDLAWLIQLEAHTTKVFKSENGGAPKELGPDAIVEVTGDNADFKTVQNTPHIADSSAVLDQYLRLWALSEYLAGDTFTTATVQQTGQALKVKERDLAARRSRQAALVPRQEQQAWIRYRAIHNAFAGQWGVEKLPMDARMKAAPGRVWQPTDPIEFQNVAFRDLACGFKSRIDYRMEAYQETRAEAIESLERIRADGEKFPLDEYQNPGANVDQRGAAGPGSASENPRNSNGASLSGAESDAKTPGAMNAKPGSSAEGASVTAAVQRATN